MDANDLNILRAAVTVFSLLLFVALMLHSYSRRRLPEHAAAAQLPFLAEEAPVRAPGKPQATHALTGDMK